MKKYAKACLVVAISVMFVVDAFAQVGTQFQAFLNRVDAADESLHSTIIDSFMATIPSFPLVEQDTIACFLYRGEGDSVQVRLERGYLPRLDLMRLHNTDLWYNFQNYKSDALIAYQFVVNNQLKLDPINPNVYFSGNWTVSVLTMPAYQDPPEIEYYPDIPHGNVLDMDFNSITLEKTLAIKIYTPPFYNANFEEGYPLVIFNGGRGYTEYLGAINILDYLISYKLIQPIIAVFVTPANNNAEYSGADVTKHAAFLVDELLIYINTRYKTINEPENRAIIGLSVSGLFAAYMAYTYPESFGLCAAQSPAFWIWENTNPLYEDMMTKPKKNIKFYLSCGIYEPGAITRFVIPLKDSLLALGYDVKWDQWHEGHQGASFRAHIDDALEFFFPGDSITAVETEASMPTAFRLEQNYPNPFNPSTTIGFSLPNISKVTLKIYDLLGREVATLLDAPYPAGNHQIIWDAKNQATGVYMVTMHAGDFRQTRKIVLMK